MNMIIYKKTLLKVNSSYVVGLSSLVNVLRTNISILHTVNYSPEIIQLITIREIIPPPRSWAKYQENYYQ